MRGGGGANGNKSDKNVWMHLHANSLSFLDMKTKPTRAQKKGAFRYLFELL